MKSFKDFYFITEKRKRKKRRRLKFKASRRYYGYPFWGPGWFNHDVGAVGDGGMGDGGGGGE